MQECLRNLFNLLNLRDRRRKSIVSKDAKNFQHPFLIKSPSPLAIEDLFNTLKTVFTDETLEM